ncbi:MAG: M28 family peptidase [Candidatus Limimorpha sp.]
MKKYFTLLTFVVFSFVTFAQSLVMINTNESKETELLFNDGNLKIHYYNGDFVLATAIDNETIVSEYTLVDEIAFSNNDTYYIINCGRESQKEYISEFEENVLYKGEDIILTNKAVKPYKNDGMIAVFNKEAKLPVMMRDFPVVTVENPVIRDMMNQVSQDSIQAYVQHMQDYGERVFNGTTILQCTEWLKSKLEALGLEIEIQDFQVNSWLGNANCKNVIAIQRGTLYPDTYVVCGSHYDSFAWYGNAPGADDNATGTASVLESARILSQYDFEYSIIYCVFSAEECGLYGSDAYASRCRQQNMDIVGYFNNDMNGYLPDGDEIHIDCIYPDNVAPIGDYYMNIGQVYFPEMQVRHVNFNEGDSDHTSFNNNGYMGIYPFEDYQDYSPFIHTSNDIIGLSVNSFEMSQRYCQMNIGCLTEIANPIVSPVIECNPVTDFVAAVVPGDAICDIQLSWGMPEGGSTGDIVKFVLYRDNVVLAEMNTDVFDYQDTISVENVAEYYINTVYSDGCEAASNTISVEGAFDGLQGLYVNDFNIYPNPASEMLTIVNDSGKVVDVVIVNSIGQTMRNVSVRDTENINISDLGKGVYFIISDNVRQKLIVK